MSSEIGASGKCLATVGTRIAISTSNGQRWCWRNVDDRKRFLLSCRWTGRQRRDRCQWSMIVVVFHWFVFFLLESLLDGKDMREMLFDVLSRSFLQGIIHRLIVEGVSRTFQWFGQIDRFQFGFAHRRRIEERKKSDHRRRHLPFFARTSANREREESLSRERNPFSPMFIQSHVTLKGLRTVFAFDLRSSIGVRTFMSAEIRELSVGLRTELDRRTMLNILFSFSNLTSHFHGLILEWIFRCCFNPDDVWKLFPQSRQVYKRFSHSLASLEFDWLDLICSVRWSIISVRSNILTREWEWIFKRITMLVFSSA